MVLWSISSNNSGALAWCAVEWPNPYIRIEQTGQYHIISCKLRNLFAVKSLLVECNRQRSLHTCFPLEYNENKYIISVWKGFNIEPPRVGLSWVIEQLSVGLPVVVKTGPTRTFTIHKFYSRKESFRCLLNVLKVVSYQIYHVSACV